MHRQETVAPAKSSGIEKKLLLVAVVCALVGLLGMVDTIWFYAAGTRPLLPDLSLWLTWPSYVVDLNLFIPGIIVALGIWSKRRLFKVFGIVLAIVWAVGAASVVIVGVYGLIHPSIQIPAGYGIRAILFFSGLLAICIWEYSVLVSAGSNDYFYVVPRKRAPQSIGKQINTIATVITVIGLIGVGNTVWFYATGTQSQIFDAALTLGWTSFALYLNVFVPGIFIGPGIRTQTDAFRIFGMIFSAVWGFAVAFLIAAAVVTLPHAPSFVYALDVMTMIGLLVWCLKFLVWQFNVLRGPEAVQYFSDAYEFTADPSTTTPTDEATCPARDSNSEPPG